MRRESERFMSEYLFVYGTLASNSEHEMHRHLASNAEYAGEGSFNGQLYRIGPYPGAVPSSNPEDKVFGELYRLDNAEELFVHLDDYEGCGPDDPQPTEFVRRMEAVYLKDGTRSQAWIYLFNRTVADLPRIVSGRFTDQ
jgi:gamma-glutamylcyclotransferase (GGCT)/AIG2-like uncharacterized protein YtfP